MASASASAPAWPPHVRPRASCHRSQPLIASAFCDRKRKISHRLSHAILKERGGQGEGDIPFSAIGSSQSQRVCWHQCNATDVRTHYCLRHLFGEISGNSCLLSFPFPSSLRPLSTFLFLHSDAIRDLFYFAGEIHALRRRSSSFLPQLCTTCAGHPVPRNSI